MSRRLTFAGSKFRRACCLEIGDLRAVDELHRQHFRGRGVPVDLRDMNVGPVLKIFAKPFGVAAFGDVIHFFVDRHVKFAKHAGPVGIFVELRKTFGEFRDLFQDDDVAFDRRVEIRPLDLNRDLFAGVQPCTINLAERCGGDRFELKFA